MLGLKIHIQRLLLGALVLLLTPSLALAQEINSGDMAWMMTSTALVLLMTIPGLALYYGGMVRKKNVLATVMQTFAVTCLVAVMWACFVYSLAFGNGSEGMMGKIVGDFSKAFLGGVDMNAAFVLGAGMAQGAIPFTITEPTFMMFQMTFAIITPALIAGAFADRMKFSGFLLFMALWVVVVYAPIAHMMWHPNGWGFGEGVLDFAGGTVVHVNAGVAGLVCALVMGKRKGYPHENFAPHNLVLCMIGASLLWVGWFGFNAGSAGAANGRAGLAMTVTMVASAVAALAWMLTEWGSRGKPSLLGIITGAIAGLVAITPAAGFVDVFGALGIGIAAGVICYWGATKLKKTLGYDDSLDAFGVHGVGGLIGAILTGVFAKSAIGGDAAKGLIDGNAAQIWIQIEGVVVTIVWAAIGTFIVLKVVDAITGLRVDEEVERDGLDRALHGETMP